MGENLLNKEVKKTGNPSPPTHVGESLCPHKWPLKDSETSGPVLLGPHFSSSSAHSHSQEQLSLLIKLSLLLLLTLGPCCDSLSLNTGSQALQWVPLGLCAYSRRNIVSNSHKEASELCAYSRRNIVSYSPEGGFRDFEPQKLWVGLRSQV